MNEKYENSIKMLKYHKDPFQRKLMTKEEVDFLLQLQKEMNTQDSLGNADPRYWVIRDWDKTYGKNLNNSDGILVFDNASGETICDIPNAVFDSATAEICCSKIIELINERLTEKLAVAGIFHKSKKTETGSLKSIAGAKGLAKKGMILLAVLIAYRLDLTAGTTYIRDMVILAFVANEALSIIENAGLMGVPMPAVITKAVDMLQQDKDNKKQA